MHFRSWKNDLEIYCKFHPQAFRVSMVQTSTLKLSKHFYRIVYSIIYSIINSTHILYVYVYIRIYIYTYIYIYIYVDVSFSSRSSPVPPGICLKRQSWPRHGWRTSPSGAWTSASSLGLDGRWWEGQIDNHPSGWLHNIYIYHYIYNYIYILHIYNVCIIVCMYIYTYIYAHTLQWSYPVVWNNDEVNMLWYAARLFVDTGHSYRVHFSIFAVICLIMYILQQQLPKYLLTTIIWSYIYIHQTLSSSCYQCFTYPWNYFNICL